MDWQLTAVIVTASGAGLYLARSAWRAWKAGQTGCKGGCGCPSRPLPEQQSLSHISLDSLTLRQRKTDPA
jgi:hypothetical protein